MAIILLVEDDRFLSETVRSFLEWKEHSVDRAFEGHEALEKMQYGKYDLVILDWQLPGMQGVDICRNYRQSGGTAPILMLSGKAGSCEVQCATEAGASYFVSKPFKLEELENNVKQALGAA